MLVDISGRLSVYDLFILHGGRILLEWKIWLMLLFMSEALCSKRAALSGAEESGSIPVPPTDL